MMKVTSAMLLALLVVPSVAGAQEGYRLVQEDAHHSFGHDLVGQNWELALR